MSVSPAISTIGLRKEFGEKVAVSDLTLNIARGEVFGFLGPNGAGKTTSVKMLLGLVAPTQGTGEILGARLGDHRVRARIGFLPEHFRFHGWLTGAEFLELHGQLHRLSADVISRRTAELLELVGLADAGSKKLQAYSKGMLQRIGLAQTLINEPELIILDEPTSGLDPFGRRLVRDIVRDLRSMGRTVFINSHLLSEIEITCDRVAFIKSGAIVRSVDLHQMQAGTVSLSVRTRGVTAGVLAGLRQWAGEIQQDGDDLLLTLPGEDVLPAVNRYLIESGVDVFAFTPRAISLEDLFVQLIGSDSGQ